MCNNYRAPNSVDLRRAFDLQVSSPDEWPLDVFPHRPAPILRLDADGRLEAVVARFGLVPFGNKDEKPSWSTMNARIETAATKWSFRRAWQRRQWCAIPAWCIYEPYYESATSRSTRWAIALDDGQLSAVAGLWDRWLDPQGNELLSFAMLTINCDGHPVLARFHKWLDEHGLPNEKRTPLQLPPEQIPDWLATTPDDARTFERLLLPEHLATRPEPLPPRPRKT